MSKIITVVSTLALGLLAQQSYAQGKECDLTSLRSNGKSVSCEITGNAENGLPGKVKAVINVERVKVNKASDEINPSKPDEEVEVFRMTVGGEYNCDKCGINSRTERAILSPEVKQFRTFTELNNFVINEGKKKMEEAAKLGKEERQKQDSEERCLTRDGEKLTGKDRMECRIDRMSSMDDEKSSEYFHKYLKDDLQAMLQSNNPQDQATAMQLLNKVNTESTNEVVKASVRDLAAYGQYNQKQNEMLSQITSMQPNDPRRREALQALGTMKQQWGSYFQSRGLEVNNINSQVADSLIQSMMSQDLSEYQRELDSRYNAIVEQHRVTSPGVNGTNAMAPGTGRLSRGMVTGYAGAPGSVTTPMMPNQQQPMFPQQQRPPGMNGLPTSPQMGGARPGFGKPLMGTPVR